jgi:hypothetical protein
LSNVSAIGVGHGTGGLKGRGVVLRMFDHDRSRQVGITDTLLFGLNVKDGKLSGKAMEPKKTFNFM